MYIQPVRFNPEYKRPSFNGELKIKGLGWDERILNKLIEAQKHKKQIPSLVRMLKGYNVIVRQKAKRAGANDPKNYHGEPIFKLVFTRVKENSSIAELADTFGLIPKKSLTKQYLSSFSMTDQINEKSFKKLARKYSLG